MTCHASKPKKLKRYHIDYRKVSLTDVDKNLDKFFKCKGYRDERPMTMEMKQKEKKG